MEAGEDRAMGDQAGAEAEGEAGSVARRQRRRWTAWEGREGVRAASPKMRKCADNTDQGPAAPDAS